MPAPAAAELPPTQRSITFRGKECAGQAPDGPAAAAAACTGANCEGKAGPPAAEQRQALQPIDVNVAAAAAQSVPRLGARRGARR